MRVKREEASMSDRLIVQAIGQKFPEWLDMEDDWKVACWDALETLVEPMRAAHTTLTCNFHHSSVEEVAALVVIVRAMLTVIDALEAAIPVPTEERYLSEEARGLLCG